ncbi:MAG: hypothetical protein ACI84K_000987 [Pseudohongiellaceae bacterium]|jgi:hypothetical protein
MTNKLPANKSKQHEIQAFLEHVAKAPAVIKGNSNGRLLFAMDATASREPMWDIASQIHADMFESVVDIGGLSIQLCYYRGFNEFKFFPWTDQPISMLNSISSVRCHAGKTQISKILEHALSQTKKSPIQALVFIGDAMEENIDTLGDLAGQLGIYRTPAFFFQEGSSPTVTRAYQQLARLSGGAHCSFDAKSAHILADLLKAVARYSVGGLRALENQSTQSEAVKRLTQQLGRKK